MYFGVTLTQKLGDERARRYSPLAVTQEVDAMRNDTPPLHDWWAEP
jgi:hypothetical protein